MLSFFSSIYSICPKNLNIFHNPSLFNASNKLAVYTCNKLRSYPKEGQENHIEYHSYQGYCSLFIRLGISNKLRPYQTQWQEKHIEYG